MPVVESRCRKLYSQSFGRFLRRPENRAARLACSQIRAALKSSNSTSTLCFLHGPPGSGKSHLVAALIEPISRCSSRRAMVVAARDLGKRLAGQITDEATPNRRYRDADLLVIEDIQQLPSSAAAAIVALLDARRLRRQATLITASSGPLALPGLPARLTSRLVSGLVVRLRPFGPASLHKLARFWCGERNVPISDAALVRLAEESQTGIRTMLGKLTRLQQLSRQSPRLLDMKDLGFLANADEVLRDSPLEAIAKRVGAWFDLPVEQIRGRDRRPNVIWPRQVAMHMARHHTRLSLAAIGAYFGNCDHTTVMHALRKVTQRLMRDADLMHAMAELLS